jgi:5'-3' exonuclease
MGIPFYFASLIKSHKGIVQPVRKNSPLNVDVFVVDFNCLIHRYLKDEDPFNSILQALEYILETFCKAKQVIIAMDGLVPYGKIVQQRYRRMREKENGVFDRNQISPDTPYMRDLESLLKLKFPYAIINGTNIPGEGEHKLIHELQKLPEQQRRSICIYGLDADLILISLQHHALSDPKKMWLLRESAEFNDPKMKEAEFATLSVWILLTELPIPIEQYIVLSILCFGNDFMPNLAMFSLREGGYDRALQIYKDCGKPNLTTAAGRKSFLTYSAIMEFSVLKERIGLRKRPEEKALVKDKSLFKIKYGLHVLDGVTNMQIVANAYWKTFHWTWEYFKTGNPKNWDWVYPYSDAPLIEDIVASSEHNVEEKPLNYKVTKQLQFIMPASSLRTAKRLVRYPNEIYSETRNPWMKRFDWEMKPRISLPWHPSEELTTISLL